MKISNIPKENLVYIDESGIEYNMCKDKGWGKKGKIIQAKKSGKYYQRTNIIAGLVNNKSIAPVVYNGACNTEFFNNWVEQSLIKELKSGQYVIMDNASFHKSKKTIELIEAVGCKVIFLPPYSPDFNPIEQYWANLKHKVKSIIYKFNSIYDAIQYLYYKKILN